MKESFDLMDFERIWLEFSWVIEEMREGMGFFEGYMPFIHQENLLDPLTILIARSRFHSFQSSVWADDATEEVAEEDFSLPKVLELFERNQLVSLSFEYEVAELDFPLYLRLIFEKEDARTNLNVICYREAVLESANPKDAIRASISELRTLRLLFGGDALFIGPDASEYPGDASDSGTSWLRIE